MDQKIVGFSKFTVTELTDKPFLRFSGHLGAGVHHGVQQEVGGQGGGGIGRAEGVGGEAGGGGRRRGGGVWRGGG